MYFLLLLIDTLNFLTVFFYLLHLPVHIFMGVVHNQGVTIDLQT